MRQFVLTAGSIATREERATIRARQEKPVAEAESDLAGACGGQIRFSRSGAQNAATRRLEGAKRPEKETPVSGEVSVAKRAEVICSPGRRRRAGEQITGARRAERN